MAGLADLYKSQVNDYFPDQSVRPYTPPQQQQPQQPQMAIPDMGAARSRSINGMGAMLPLLAMGLMMGKGKSGGGAAMRGFAQGLNNSMNNQSALEVWKANQINGQRQAQQEQAMERIKQNRAYMAKIFEKDPNLWGDQQAVALLMAGDTDGFSGHLAEINWSIQKEEPARIKYEFKNVNGQMVAIDPYTGEIAKNIGHYGDPVKPSAPKETNPVTDFERVVFAKVNAGQELTSDLEKRIAQKKGWTETPEEPKEAKPLSGADRTRIMNEVRGGKDIFGRQIEGFVNLYNDPSQVQWAIDTQYGDWPEGKALAYQLAFGDSTLKNMYGAVPLDTPTVSTAPPSNTDNPMVDTVRQRIQGLIDKGGDPQKVISQAKSDAKNNQQILEAVGIVEGEILNGTTSNPTSAEAPSPYIRF